MGKESPRDRPSESGGGRRQRRILPVAPPAGCQREKGILRLHTALTPKRAWLQALLSHQLRLGVAGSGANVEPSCMMIGELQALQTTALYLNSC